MSRKKVIDRAPSGLYVGFDLGLSFGWAVLREDGSRVASGTWDLSGSSHEGGGMRLLRLRGFIADLFNEVGRPVVVGYELVRRHAGTQAAQIHGELRGQVKATLEEAGVPFRDVSVQGAKRRATGKGNASKDEMCKAANDRWDLRLNAKDNEDEADALWIGDEVRSDLRGRD